MDVGKFFMFGFAGEKPADELIHMIRHEGLGGVILFNRNISSIEQLRRLTNELQSAAGGDLLISIDQEGGRVARLPKSFLDIPPMREFGSAFEKSGDPKPAYELGFTLGEQLLSLGINVDFAPVLDVDTNPKNPVIGDRSFSRDPQIVASLGCEMIKGMQEAGIIACGKHFPGHGDTSEDSHKALPILEHDIERLRNVELVPFQAAFDAGLPSIMSAHVIYKGVDPNGPATLSKKIMTDLLRGEMKYNGVVFSHDLEMDAIADSIGVSKGAVKAFNAGCDIIIICHKLERQKDALDEFKRAIDEGKISEERAMESLRRVDDLLL